MVEKSDPTCLPVSRWENRLRDGLREEGPLEASRHEGRLEARLGERAGDLDSLSSLAGAQSSTTGRRSERGSRSSSRAWLLSSPSLLLLLLMALVTALESSVS